MIKYIKGSWFEFIHATEAEGNYWNHTCANFNCNQWDAKIKEMSEIGIEYLVLMASVLNSEAYFNSRIFPRARLGCNEPIEAVLTAADNYGVKFFISNGLIYNNSLGGRYNNPEVINKSLKVMSELAELYSHHESFYGWYWPDEAFIDKYFSEDYIKYVNICSKEGRLLVPDACILIAPYGTRVAIPDDKYVKQLELMDVDIIAYQDEIGVRKTKTEESAAIYEGLRKAHDKVLHIALWADVEIFDFVGGVYESALIPAQFSRIIKQLEAVSPYVDTILVYQYLGMMNKPDSSAFAGHPSSADLYTSYMNWLKANK